MSTIYICVLTSGNLHASIDENVQYSTILLSQNNMVCLQAAINSHLGSRKPVTIIDGLRVMGNDVAMWNEWKFLVHSGPSRVYMSVVEPMDDGVSSAQFAIQQHILFE
ncbi:hypothetical protein CAEBREN_07274 [Caenorhabditis brenneri]|uniref:Uncharacterized protein n=1 Tax=Caenorhabditis brenneri TaxID=135651 RepID=G0MGY2_CAEBE|nr:hypothetical protein CAEBREN_07274 [Caenorhabditis brenneri]